MPKASVAIFKNKVDYPEDVSCPTVPQELFEAAKKIIESKSCEIVRTKSGVFIISYAENGPFSTKINDEWLPVYIMRLHQWSAGGITKSEMSEYEAL